MSRTKDYLVTVTAPDGRSGDGVTVTAATPESAEKKARAHWKGTAFYDGTYATEEAPA